MSQTPDSSNPETVSDQTSLFSMSLFQKVYKIHPHFPIWILKAVLEMRTCSQVHTSFERVNRGWHVEWYCTAQTAHTPSCSSGISMVRSTKKKDEEVRSSCVSLCLCLYLCHNFDNENWKRHKHKQSRSQRLYSFWSAPTLNTRGLWGRD